MHALFALLILAATPTAPIDAPASAASVEVFACDFGETADRNYDGWPDDWTRKRGAGYPLFVSAKIVGEPKDTRTPERYALRIDLDGGAAAIYSPPIPVSPLFSYRLEAQLRTEKLAHDVAYVSLGFFDADGKLLETHESHHNTQVEKWTAIEVGPVLPASSKAVSAVIGLHVRPRHEGAADIQGAAAFSRIKVARLPRILLRSQNKSHLHQANEPIEITCDVSGLLKPNPLVTFALEDVAGQVIATQTMPLIATSQSSGTGSAPLSANGNAHGKAADSGHGSGHATADDHAHDAHKVTTSQAGFAGRAVWKPTPPGYGYYRVRAVMEDGDQNRLERVATLAVLRPLPANMEVGEFGWSLPHGDEKLSLQELLPLVSQGGVHWLKFPMWCSEEDPSRLDRLAWFSDRVGMQHVQMIGVLDVPPDSFRKTFGSAENIPIATAFVEAPLWKPAVEPVLTRLPLKVRWWQLGADSDQSFVGFPQLEQKMAEVKKHFLKFGQEVKIGFAWPWLEEPPVTRGAPWDFLSRSTQPSLTAPEIAAYLAGDATASGAPQCWMKMKPLAASRYPLPERATDLAQRMLAAKIGRANGIFLPDPFEKEHGIFNADGTPGPLFLPWRTTAMLLSGTEYLGSITLPGGSTNHVFRRQDQAVMVVWNDKPTTEQLYLGEHVEHFDLWGRTAPLEIVSAEGVTTQSINVGPLPTFITGVSLPIAQWRINFKFETTHIPSVLGREQQAKYKFTNAFAQGVGGEIRVLAPEDWEASPLVMNFKAAAGEERHEAFAVRFKPDAQSGPQMIRFDVKLTADRDYAFSVYQPIHVGANDLFITSTASLAENGNLVVEQVFTNQTDEFVSFNCLLFAPNRRRERVQVLTLGRGRHTATFILPRGAELMGQTLLLRAEEIDGDRVLNYRLVPQQ